MQKYLAATVWLLWVGAGWTQTNRGGLAGTVSDKSGATVPGATITLTSTGTNETFRTTSSEGGVYSVPNLDPVLYRVEVAAHGFQKRTVDRVKVDTANVTTLNFQLDPGTVQTEVTVSANPPVLNTESGTSSQTVTELQIDNAPLVNRSVLDL